MPKALIRPMLCHIDTAQEAHVDVAFACGEDRLFPAVRATTPEAEIAITGVSCREQIGYGTGRPARHLVEVLADALAD